MGLGGGHPCRATAQGLQGGGLYATSIVFAVRDRLSLSSNRPVSASRSLSRGQGLPPQTPLSLCGPRNGCARCPQFQHVLEKMNYIYSTTSNNG